MSTQSVGETNPQHVQVGVADRYENRWGVTVEHTAWLQSHLDEGGRCCGRKPHGYKRALRNGPGSICLRCHREYGSDGDQRPNETFRFRADGCYHRDAVVDHGKLACNR
jgi:hypothetical protein